MDEPRRSSQRSDRIEPPRIGELGAGDREAAVALWHACGLTRPWNDPGADFDRALFAAHAAILGARTADGALAGTVMVGEDGHRGWLYYLGVRADGRGRGIGRALVAAAETWLAARGVPKVELLVRHGNPATRFYAAIGYGEEAVTVMARRLVTETGTDATARG